MARRVVKPIGPSNNRLEDFFSKSTSEVRIALGLISSIRFRDSIYQQFKINRSEVWALTSLESYLAVNDKVIVSQQMFIDHCSGNFQQKRKIMGFMSGLLKKGCLGSFEYVNTKGSFSVGITDFGFTVINAYYNDVNALFGRYIKMPKINNQRSIDITTNIPIRYRSLMCA